MSIPFCIAVRGTPTMSAMATYGSRHERADCIDRVPDENVARLNRDVKAALLGGRSLNEDLPITVADFAHDRAVVPDLVRHIGGERRVPPVAYGSIERFVSALPDVDLHDMLRSREMLPKANT